MPQYFFTVRRSEVEMKYPNGVMLPNNAAAISYADFLSWSTVNAGSFDYAGDAWAYSPGHALGRREINTALRVQDVAAGNAA